MTTDLEQINLRISAVAAALEGIEVLFTLHGFGSYMGIGEAYDTLYSLQTQLRWDRDKIRRGQDA